MQAQTGLFLPMLKSFSMLCLVLVFIFLVLYLIKKLNKQSLNSKDFIKILLVHYISPKEKLIIIDILGEKMLLGVTSNSINKICDIKADDTSFQNIKVGKSNIFNNLLLKKIKQKLNDKKII